MATGPVEEVSTGRSASGVVVVMVRARVESSRVRGGSSGENYYDQAGIIRQLGHLQPTSLISAQSSKVITLQSLGVHFSPPKLFSFERRRQMFSPASSGRVHILTSAARHCWPGGCACPAAPRMQMTSPPTGPPAFRSSSADPGSGRAMGMAMGQGQQFQACNVPSQLPELPSMRVCGCARRAGLQISQYWMETEARPRQAFSEIWVLEDFHCSLLIGQYIELEEQLLPAQFRRVKAVGWIPSKDLRAGFTYNPHDPNHVLPRIPSRTECIPLRNA